MPRLRFLLNRLGKAILILVAAAAVNFMLIRLAPGDPASVMAGEAGAADQAYVQHLRHEFGLDKPLYVQLAIYIKQVATLDLGYSYRQRSSVAALIFERLPATLLLTGTAFCFALLIGVALGAIAAIREGDWVDRLITSAVLIVYATPIFWVGLLGILVFSVWLDWLPAFGNASVGLQESGVASFFDAAKHLVLPASTLGLFYVATYARLTRAKVSEVQSLDFVKTARAKGLPWSRILRAHILRNALLPVVTLAGLQAGQLVGGAVLVETVFGWPGIGRLAFDALLQRDYSILLGVFLVSSAVVLLFNFLTDILYSFLDPRIEAIA
jgi:peptide/nickel transport system permease protein